MELAIILFLVLGVIAIYYFMDTLAAIAYYFMYKSFPKNKPYDLNNTKESLTNVSSSADWDEKIRRINEHNAELRLNSYKVDYSPQSLRYNARRNESNTKQHESHKINFTLPYNEELDKKGYLYIMINASLPAGWIKIGFTQRDPKTRAKELSNSTGFPSEYIVAYYKEFKYPDKAEKLVHDKLEEYRITKDRDDRKREFFNFPLDEAIAVIQNVAKTIK